MRHWNGTWAANAAGTRPGHYGTSGGALYAMTAARCGGRRSRCGGASGPAGWRTGGSGGSAAALVCGHSRGRIVFGPAGLSGGRA